MKSKSFPAICVLLMLCGLQLFATSPENIVQINFADYGNTGKNWNSAFTDLEANRQGELLVYTKKEANEMTEQINAPAPQADGDNASPMTWYVSPSGSDTTGDGTINNPYRTPQFAIDVSNPYDTVQLLSGHLSH